MLLRDEIEEQTTVLERVLRENRRLALDAKKLLTSTDTTHANEPFDEPFDEPFGGGDAEARLASVDARLKTFAERWES